MYCIHVRDWREFYDSWPCKIYTSFPYAVCSRLFTCSVQNGRYYHSSAWSESFPLAAIRTKERHYTGDWIFHVKIITSMLTAADGAAGSEHDNPMRYLCPHNGNLPQTRSCILTVSSPGKWDETTYPSFSFVGMTFSRDVCVVKTEHCFRR
jgi:hypothetical protein